VPRIETSGTRRPDPDGEAVGDPAEQVEIVELTAVDDRARVPVRHVSLAIAVTALVAVALVGLNLLPGRGEIAVSGPGVSRSPSPARLSASSPAAATQKPTERQLAAEFVGVVWSNGFTVERALTRGRPFGVRGS
jgi:hypothetical protein